MRTAHKHPKFWPKPLRSHMADAEPDKAAPAPKRFSFNFGRRSEDSTSLLFAARRGAVLPFYEPWAWPQSGARVGRPYFVQWLTALLASGMPSPSLRSIAFLFLTTAVPRSTNAHPPAHCAQNRCRFDHILIFRLARAERSCASADVSCSHAGAKQYEISYLSENFQGTRWQAFQKALQYGLWRAGSAVEQLGPVTPRRVQHAVPHLPHNRLLHIILHLSCQHHHRGG